MEKHIIDEKTGIGYTLQGDYYIPDLTLPSEEEYPPLGKYGRMRLTYLKENKKALYSVMMMNGTLNSHLHDVDEQANAILEQIVKAFAEVDSLNEKLKVSNQMKWVGLIPHLPHNLYLSFNILPQFGQAFNICFPPCLLFFQQRQIQND